MSQGTAEYSQFEQRYLHLRKLFFSPLSESQYDDEGEEIPSAHPNKGAIIEMFMKMGVQVPHHPEFPLTPIVRKQAQE
jgi:hypothetical protein